MIRRMLSVTAVVLVVAYGAWAQYLQAIPADKPGNERARMDKMEKWLHDWANLARYADANQKLGPAAAGEKRVVFMGDSITDGWDIAKSFPGKPYVNRGIGGQTTPQMLVRFHPDVVALKPAVVVILAGTNDIAGNTGPETLEEIEGNLQSMADIARAEGIRVVMSSVTPVYPAEGPKLQFYKDRPPEKIRAINEWLRAYCTRTGCVYLDYYAHMVDDKGELRRDISEDGLHPNAKGYAIMAPLAEEAIQEAVKK